MNVQQEIRKVFRFLQMNEIERDEHSNNGHVILSGKKYFIGKMSYDEWYLEPYRKGRTERDTFDKGILWEKSDTLPILQIFVDNNYMRVSSV